MSEANSVAGCPSSDENQQENSQNETVLKNSNNKVRETRAPKVPAKVNATRTHQSPPFSKEVYNLFICSLKYGEPAYPSTKELRELDFYSGKGTSQRKRFRRLLARFELHVVQGSLVCSPSLEEDVLVHKRTGKILVAKEDVEKIIRRAHLWGNNQTNDEGFDERKCKHYNVRRTLTILGKDFSIREREFGISRSLVQSVVFRCISCKKVRLACDDELKQKQLNGADENMTCAEAEFQSVAKSLASSEQALIHNDKNQLEKARFPSMAAHVPDKECIWYDRKSIADTTDRFEKLMMVLGEMRGEMGLAVKGDVQAKQRLEAKLYCAQLLIKDHSKTIQRSLILEDSPRAFRTELLALKHDYRQTGQTGIFSSDITDLLAHVKDHKLVLSPLIVNEIEDFVTLQSDMTACSEETAR